MSLYSSIEVPKEEKKAIKPPGFAGLYDEPTTATVIEAAPILYARPEPLEESTALVSKSNAALQFAPSRRRPLPVKRKLPVPGASYVDERDGTQSSSSNPVLSTSNVPHLEVTNTFEDYADYQPDHLNQSKSHIGDDGKTQRKKHKKKKYVPVDMGWNDDYDPSRPIDFEDYIRSNERQQEREEYRAHREARKRRENGSSSESDRSSEESLERRKTTLTTGNNTDNLASFATSRKAVSFFPSEETGIPPPPPPFQQSQVESRFASYDQSNSSLPDTAEEAYARRAALQGLPPATLGAPGTSQQPPPPPTTDQTDQRFSTAFQTTYSASPNVISPATPAAKLPKKKQEAKQQSSASSFAQRYMASHGWKKGQGLGASSSGRLAPLFIKPQKDGTGKIIDRHRDSKPTSTSISRVVLISGIIDPGATLDDLFQQDIGDTCSATYGLVERVAVDVDLGRVFVKFADSLSALRCISTVADEFNGRKVKVRYYPLDAFESGNWSVQVDI